MKKGIALSFSFIFAMILIVFILGVGGYLVMKVYKAGHEVDVARFRNDLERDFRTVSRMSGGSALPYEYVLPKGVDEVCFVEFVKLRGCDVSGVSGESLRLRIRSYCEAGGGNKNVFFGVKSGYGAVEALRLQGLRVEDGVVCFRGVQGKIRVVFRNEKGYVYVEKPR